MLTVSTDFPLVSDKNAPVLDWSRGEIPPYQALGASAPLREEKDIWGDGEVLHFVQKHQHTKGLTAQERDRIYRRARGYRWLGSSLFKLVEGGALRAGPQPSERMKLALDTHRDMWNFGVQRVIDRLQKNYYWRGLGETVVAVVQACLPCARVKAGFRESGKELHPLPIRGLGYRWGVDFAGPLQKTTTGNTYVLVRIEHFTKWVELIPLPSKSSKDAARALLDGVLSRYGAPGEVLTDQGREFQGEFQTLLSQHAITH